jgi:ferritin-like metal-binding protein YciE
VHELKDLYSAETQLVEELPGMADKASDSDLKKAFRAHLEETKRHRSRLEQIFKDLEFSPGGHRCEGIAGLIKEARELTRDVTDAEVLDAALIAAAQRVEHYEMAGYGVARAYAEKLGDYAAADLLQQSLDEEGAADRKLTTLALRRINFEAATA